MCNAIRQHQSRFSPLVPRYMETAAIPHCKKGSIPSLDITYHIQTLSSLELLNFPLQGEFGNGKWHPGWGRVNRKIFIYSACGNHLRNSQLARRLTDSTMHSRDGGWAKVVRKRVCGGEARHTEGGVWRHFSTTVSIMWKPEDKLMQEYFLYAYS